MEGEMYVGKQIFPSRFRLYVGHLRGFTVKVSGVTKGKGDLVQRP